MSTPATQTEPAAERVVADVTCAGCGCLCDDIAVTSAGSQIVEARNACPLGQDWFAKPRGKGEEPAARIDGQPAAFGDALERAAVILRNARAPLVLGLSQTTLEAQAAAIAIADHIGAIIDPAHSTAAASRWLAVQRVGIVSATLGEVKNRADVLVFWNVDPVLTHPRHFERYSVESRGRFVPRGRSGRSVIVADAQRTATAERADLFVRVPAEKQFESLWALRAIVRGVSLDASRVERSCRVSFDVLSSCSERMQAARYGAFFFGASLGLGRGGSAIVETALLLVRDLNARTRWVALGLGEPGNAAGAEAVLGWQTGYPLAVDLRRGFPRYAPQAATADAILTAGAADAVLVVGEPDELGLSAAACMQLERTLRIVIAPGATRPGSIAAVAIHSAIPSIEAPGTFLRCDGVSLPLRPALGTDAPSDQAILRALATVLDRPGAP